VDCIILTANVKGPAIKTAGPYRIATELRNNGFSVQVIDISIFDDPKKLAFLLDRFVDNNTLWIGISNTFMESFLGTKWSTLYDYDRELHTDKVRNKARELMSNFNRFKNLKWIYGDAGARTDLTEVGFIRFHGFVDQQVLDFTKSCSQGKQSSENIIYKKEFDNFCSSSILWQPNDILLGEIALPIEISRGCIFKCAFCRYPLNGKRKLDYIKDPDVLYRELMRNYELYGVKDYLFTDDTYNDSMIKLRQIRDVVKKLPFEINFSTYLRLDLMIRQDGMAEILRETGLIGAFFGIETMDPDDAKFIGKNVPFQQQVEYLWKLKDGLFKDVMINSNFILGLPNDNENKIKNLFTWLEGDNNPLDSFTVTELRIFPEGITDLPYQSDIDKDYKDLGYEFVNDGNELYWVNKKINLNSRRLTKLADDFNLRVGYRSKVGPFHMMDFLNLGIDKKDLLTLTSRELRTKYNIGNIKNDIAKKYYDILMNGDF
jgi:Radical SAM superfamily